MASSVGLPGNPLLARPMTLQDFVIAIGEECLGSSIEHRLQKMQRAEAVVQENATPLFEARRFRCELVQAREIGRVSPLF